LDICLANKDYIFKIEWNWRMILKFRGKAQIIEATLLYPSGYLRLPQVRKENSNRILKILEVGNKVLQGTLIGN
jgi:hypothetical protein